MTQTSKNDIFGDDNRGILDRKKCVFVLVTKEEISKKKKKLHVHVMIKLKYAFNVECKIIYLV